MVKTLVYQDIFSQWALFHNIDGSKSSESAAYIAVEIKRKVTIEAVEQLTRYMSYLENDPYLPGGVRGMLVGQTVVPQAKTLAESRGYRVVTVDYDELRGLQQDELRLF